MRGCLFGRFGGHSEFNDLIGRYRSLKSKIPYNDKIFNRYNSLLDVSILINFHRTVDLFEGLYNENPETPPFHTLNVVEQVAVVSILLSDGGHLLKDALPFLELI